MDQATNLRNIIKSYELKSEEKKTRNAKIITVTSGKGGVGKSNISINLAIALSRLGKRVIILDADFGLANVEIMLGIRPKYSLADLMFNGKSITEIITDGPENIGFISGGSGIEELTELNSFQIQNLSEKLFELDNLADYIIIDTGAGISEALIQFIKSSDQTILVATPEPTSITDAYAVLKSVNRNTVDDASKPVIHMISNRVGSFEEGKALYAKLNVVVSRFLHVKLEYLGAVLQDTNIVRAVMEQKPISIAYPNSPAATSVAEIAKMVESGVSTEQGNQGGIRQLFSNLIRSKR